MIQWLGDQVGGVAHLIGLCLLIYAILTIVRGLDRGDMIGTIFKAAVVGIGGALLMRL